MTLTGGQQDFQSLVLSCNKDGMDALRKGQSKAAFEQFKYAEAILIANQAEGDNTSLLAVTCNNLGCYYKKVGKLHGALSYLRKALQMEVDLNTDEVTLAGTHLNICAILSKLEKHDKAVQHALCALDLINKRVSASDPDKVSQDDYSVLAIAYHNVAVERDFLHQYEKAAAAFQQGYQVANRCLGQEHPLSITLGKNCDSVLQKSQKLTKSPSAMFTDSRAALKEKELMDFTAGKAGPGDDLPMLPRLAPTRAAEAGETAPMPEGSVRQDAADWVANEASEWSRFAETTLAGSGGAPQEAEAPRPAPTLRSAPEQASEALRLAQVKDLAIPELGDKAASRDLPLSASSPPRFASLKTPLSQALEDHPEALMDIIDADRTHTVSARTAPHDYRPNRTIKGSTRTALVVRRTGVFNSTRHRDQVMTGRTISSTTAQKSAYVQKIAAERIQRAWRAWYHYCQENADWMTTTWICATMIQARWRSYHVRRVKLDRACTQIQRCLRGFLVRRILVKHRAAVAIQRHVVGMLTRLQLSKLHRGAVKIECLVRGGLARRRVARKRAFLTKTAVLIQSTVRMCIAQRRVGQLRAARNNAQIRTKAATDVQRHYRGLKGRRRFVAKREEYMESYKQYMAATRLQAMVRRDNAIKRTDQIRAAKLEGMNKAATFLRKMWLGAKTRRRYRELMSEFKQHEEHIIVAQRFARGFLVRMRMWREAIRAEEELWGALEIQRVWKGYRGRVLWESRFEEVWRREMAAAMMQRYVRGWLARTRVGRLRRRIARSEFERARLRFRSAQRIQAMARGVLARRVTRGKQERLTAAAVKLQRIARGHALRTRLWYQVIDLRASMIQASARRFLVRNRRFQLLAKVICIQAAWRRFRNYPESVRAKAKANKLERKNKATVIQQKVRQRQEEKEVARLHEAEAPAGP